MRPLSEVIVAGLRTCGEWQRGGRESGQMWDNSIFVMLNSMLKTTFLISILRLKLMGEKIQIGSVVLDILRLFGYL
jgi:hypothetical protein